MKTNFKEFIYKNKELFLSSKNDFLFVIVANKSKVIKNNFIINQTIDNLIKLCKKYKVEYIYYTNENNFIEAILNGKLNNLYKKLFIYNRSINGPINARRMLIPAFCDFNKIKYLGNDAYHMGMLCNKFHYYSILKSANIPIADFWCFQHGLGWLTEKPNNGIKVIAKLSNENNAKSLDESSVFIYKEQCDSLIDELSYRYNQPVVLQKFINGYEVTIPIFISKNEIYIPEVLGHNINGKKNIGELFINEKILKNRIQSDCNENYYNFSYINKEISESIKVDCEKIVRILGLKSFTRFDLRIDDSFSYYFNDLGSIPGILPGSSYNYLYNLYGFSYEDFLITTLMLDI